MTLPKTQSFTRPVWAIIVIVLLRIGLTTVIIYSLYSLSHQIDQAGVRGYANTRIKELTTSTGVYVLVAILEALVYWRIRRWEIRKLYAWLHITGLILAVFFVPVI